jgi:hypothetical protein
MRDAPADRLVVVEKLLQWGWSEGAGSFVTELIASTGQCPGGVR